jgi:MarR family 2-MHQ and catechol resistance regulon transcriptional repressor
MSLETEINQPFFTSESQKAVINLIYTYHWVTDKVKAALSPEDITMQQFNILRILRGSDPEPLSTLKIRERMLDKMSDTSRIVDRLLIKKLVVKKVSTQDKRLVDISITNEGKKLLERLDKNMKGTEKILANLDNNDLNKLNALLDGIRNGK